MAILISGGAGYIGSHTVAELLAAGEEAVVVDDLSQGHRAAVAGARLYELDIRESGRVRAVIRDHRVDTVIHFAARTLVGDQDHQLRQTVIALCADATMREHESPGEATLYVLQGEVDLVAGSDTARLSAGEIAEIPHERHSVHAVSDAVVLLTAMPREFETSVGPAAGAR